MNRMIVKGLKEKWNCYTFKKICTKITYTHTYTNRSKYKAWEPIWPSAFCYLWKLSLLCFSSCFYQPLTATNPKHAWTKTGCWVSLSFCMTLKWCCKVNLTIIYDPFTCERNQRNCVFKVPVSCLWRKRNKYKETRALRQAFISLGQ